MSSKTVKHIKLAPLEPGQEVTIRGGTSRGEVVWRGEKPRHYLVRYLGKVFEIDRIRLGVWDERVKNFVYLPSNYS